MRAARLDSLGETPVPAEMDEPRRGEGQALVEVAAAPVNPIDLAVASGQFYAAGDQTPYVPGLEGLGRVVEGESLAPGTRVYFGAKGGLGGSDGSMAERTVIDEATAIEVPEGTDDALAACFGIAGLAAWLPLEWRAELQEGETVLVLGATGAVGTIAVQAAKLLGAGRVVAAARDADALERLRPLGADAVVDLSSVDDAAEAFRDAAEGTVDVTLDPLWGDPVVAALEASSPFARVVQIGQSAGAEATVPSAAVRGKPLAILGHTNMAAPQEVKAAAYRRMVEEAAAGRLKVEYETYPLDRVTDMWEAQAAFPRRKLVLLPAA
ncbi:MAG: zinc-binding alcohol dehydrogenase family protein [Thermoleophilaceae bacterium]